MTSTIVYPLAVCLAGAITYLASNNPKGAELARIAYFVGLLWCVYALASHVLRIG